MRTYRAFSQEEIAALAEAAGVSFGDLPKGNACRVFNLLYHHAKEFEAAGMSPEDFFYSQLYWCCRCIYEEEARGGEAPDFEASVADILNYLMIVLSELYGEEVDPAQILRIDRELEAEFGLRRRGSFLG